MTCPVCGSAINQDFGVTSCASCGSLLFIDLEGNVQTNEAQGFDANPPPPNFEIPTFQAEPEGELPDLEQPSFEAQAPLEIPSMEATATQPEIVLEEFESIPLPEREEAGLADVLEFANSERSSEGPLTYTILIERLDTKQVRESLKDVLSDPKFQWDWRTLSTQIEAGKLELTQVNPAKASVLIHKIRDLPLRIRWRQDVY